jgi:hypothetical protein
MNLEGKKGQVIPKISVVTDAWELVKLLQS